MMKRVSLVVVFLVFVGMVIMPSLSAATPDEAKAFVKKAIDYYKANGKDKAFAAFMTKPGDFIQGELYIFILDAKGITVCHGMNPKLNGKDYLSMKDVDGKEYQREFLKVGLKGSGWVEYKYLNPVSKTVSPKKAWVEGYDNLVFGCGIYAK